MNDSSVHHETVRAWMRQTAGLPSDQLAQLFEEAIGVLWRRASPTLGEVTLAAIADRVLYNAAEQFPVFDALKLSAGGVDGAEFRERAGRLSGRELTEGVPFVLVEFLTVIGNLTADILTPVLHAELSRVTKDSSQGSGEGKL